MIHTIVSLEEVFADKEYLQLITEGYDIGYSEHIGASSQKQVRILFSTNPRDYLSI